MEEDNLIVMETLNPLVYHLNDIYYVSLLIGINDLKVDVDCVDVEHRMQINRQLLN